MGALAATHWNEAGATRFAPIGNLHTSYGRVRRCGKSHNCIEEGGALAFEQTGVHQPGGSRNRTRGVGIARSNHGAEREAGIEEVARMRRDFPLVGAATNVRESWTLGNLETNDALERLLEYRKMVDLRRTDGSEDGHDVQVTHFGQ